MLELILNTPGLDNVDSEDLMGRQTPSFLAAKNGKLDALKLLLGKPKLSFKDILMDRIQTIIQFFDQTYLEKVGGFWMLLDFACTKKSLR